MSPHRFAKGRADNDGMSKARLNRTARIVNVPKTCRELAGLPTRGRADNDGMTKARLKKDGAHWKGRGGNLLPGEGDEHEDDPHGQLDGEHDRPEIPRHVHLEAYRVLALFLRVSR